MFPGKEQTRLSLLWPHKLSSFSLKWYLGSRKKDFGFFSLDSTQRTYVCLYLDVSFSRAAKKKLIFHNRPLNVLSLPIPRWKTKGRSTSGGRKWNYWKENGSLAISKPFLSLSTSRLRVTWDNWLMNSVTIRASILNSLVDVEFDRLHWQPLKAVIEFVFSQVHWTV